jgi:hypothetical protein
VSGLPAFFAVETPKAKKPHICCECKGIIKPGETYQSAHGAWEGKWGHFKTCEDCAALREEVEDLAAAFDDEKPAFGELCWHCGEYGDELKKTFQTIATKRKDPTP